MKYHNIPTLFDNQASLINGKNIGTDSVRYIQDAGQKTAGTTYIDRNTNELYVCVTTTNSVNNDSNFSKFNLKEAFNKLDNINGVSPSSNRDCNSVNKRNAIDIAISQYENPLKNTPDDNLSGTLITFNIGRITQFYISTGSTWTRVNQGSQNETSWSVWQKL